MSLKCEPTHPTTHILGIYNWNQCNFLKIMSQMNEQNTSYTDLYNFIKT